MPKYVGNTAIPNEFSTLLTAVDVAKVNKAGDTMSGDIAMGDNSITGLSDPVDDQDAATKAYVNTIGAYASFHLGNVSEYTSAFMARTHTTGWPTRHFVRNAIRLDGAVVYLDSEASTFSGEGSISIKFYKGGTTADSGVLLHTEVIDPSDIILLNNAEEDDNTGSWSEWVVNVSSTDLGDEVDANEHLSVMIDGTSAPSGTSGIEMMVEVYYIRR